VLAWQGNQFTDHAASGKRSRLCAVYISENNMFSAAKGKQGNDVVASSSVEAQGLLLWVGQGNEVNYLWLLEGALALTGCIFRLASARCML
jgi:hypothetical protein